MPLILEVVGRKAAHMGGAARKVFQRGGTIGRLGDNDWVLPDRYISAHHATIAFADGRYSIEDTSTNGVYVNSSEHRIPRGQRYPLKDGDTVYIDDYEVRVSLAHEDMDVAPSTAALYPAVGGALFGAPVEWSADADAMAETADPLRLLGLALPGVVREGPRAAALAGGSPLSQHYRPPSAPPAEAMQSSDLEPECGAPGDYDPFAADEPPSERRSERPSQRPSERRHAASANGGLDFAAMLAAAGIDAECVSAEVSQQFGQIMRVVVAGLMDALQTRVKIKDEFRMRLTTFKQKDNNPLKFSANVEDALHNLLVKRNGAYLSPVEAFQDAFQDVRNHQMAMLEGMRVAFDAMLAEFDPQRLQQDFDRQSKGKSFLTASAKTKNWELYCNRFGELVKDADSAFRILFGDEFAKAYEDQLARLKGSK